MIAKIDLIQGLFGMSKDILEPKFMSQNRKRKSVSFIWILPLIILGILGWIAYESYMKKTNITILFKSADGLKRCYLLEYKGLQLVKLQNIYARRFKKCKCKYFG